MNLALSNNCDSISYTYNEPTIFFPYIKDIAKLAKQNGLKNVMVSNGFESIEVINEMENLIDAANIDLKCFDKKYYKKLGGNLDKVINGIKTMQQKGIWIEITTLIIPEQNDSEEELKSIASWISTNLNKNTPWHLSAFHPDYKMLDKQNTPVQTLNKAYEIGKKYNLSNVYRGNARIINDTNCKKCNNILLRRETYVTKINNLTQDNTCSKCNEKLEGVYHTKRGNYFNGTFYPKECSEVSIMFKNFNTMLKNSNYIPPKLNPKAIIVPHAGYVYSGFTANAAYNTVSNKNIKQVVVIGPSHKVAFHNCSISNYDKYKTSCGDINIDKKLVNEIKQKFDFVKFNNQAHKEHSTETQALFVKAYFPNATITEIVYGNQDYKQLSKLVTYLIKNNIFVIISTDLSHFYNINQANKKDNICIQAIKNKDLTIWEKGCEACGRIGVKALINTCNELNLQTKVIDYRTSADYNKDENRVVGYTSVIIGNQIV